LLDFVTIFAVPIENAWTGVAVATGVSGLALVATAVVFGHITRHIPGLKKDQSFALRNRMLFIYGGIVLLCVCMGALHERAKAAGDCSSSSLSTSGDHSPNIPCNSGTITISN
jgi:hypothetical protein